MKTSLLLMSPILALAIAAPGLSAQTIFGVTESDALFSISNAATPNSTTVPVPVTGLTPGQTIAGMDYRPATGELFALGYNYANGSSQLYRINTATAAATAVNATPITLALGTGSIGFDFNPTVDRIRVVGATSRKNYRLNPLNGSIAATDGDLAFAAGDVHAAQTPSVGAVAYTNSYLGTEATSLYDYDESLNALLLQNPPNNGTINTIGASGIAVNTNNRTVDMDIYFDPISRMNLAFLSANTGPGNIDGLFSINLANGAASSLGSVGLPVKDIAVVIERNIAPLDGDQLIYALTRTNRNLISFSSGDPSIIRTVVPVTGISAGQTLAGIDFRPENGALYGLGYNPANSRYQLYTINPETGAASAVNAGPDSMDLGNDVNAIGFDFNPVVDRIRVVSGKTRANYRLNPITGSIAATDIPLLWSGTDPNVMLPVRVGSVAYTNSYPRAAATSLHGFNDTVGIFVTINPPNNGTVNTTMAGNILLNNADLSIDMDFYYDSVTGMNFGYLAANPMGSNNDMLYRFNPSGAPMMIGSIGLGIPVADIAVRSTFRNAAGNLAVQSGMKAASPVVFPNPAFDKLSISLPAGMTEGARYRITDLSGRLLLEGDVPAGQGQISVPLSGLAGGVYYLSLSCERCQEAPVKFIKQ